MWRLDVHDDRRHRFTPLGLALAAEDHVALGVVVQQPVAMLMHIGNAHQQSWRGHPGVDAWGGAPLLLSGSRL